MWAEVEGAVGSEEGTLAAEPITGVLWEVAFEWSLRVF